MHLAPSGPDMYERELSCALKAAHDAAAMLRPAFHAGYPEKLDVAVERDLRRHLIETFPDYGYRGEETAGVTPPRDPEGHLWLVDPHDGTHAAAKGYRGSAVSIALLRKGLPVLGVVFAFSAPDDEGDLFWWVEGLGPLRRNGREIHRAWKTSPDSDMTVLVSQDADGAASVNAAVAHPMRYRGIPGIAYRLALVAAGDADLAISLNGPTGWDVAGGHALLRGAGGDLFGHEGRPVNYDPTGAPNVSMRTCYGGFPDLVKNVTHWEWRKALQHNHGDVREFLAYLKPGKTVSEAGILARAQGCLLGQFAGDALGSLVEFKSQSSIRAQYPSGPRLLQDGGSWQTIAGQPTDDSEMALALARSIVKKNDYGEEEAANAYAQWYDSHPFDIGNTTSMALDGASDALHQGLSAALAAHAQASSTSQANGALMRVSPLAIFGTALEPHQIARLARTDAGITHPHEVCRSANAVFSVAISYAIKKGYSAELTYRFAWSWAHEHAVDPVVLESLEAAEFEAPTDFMTKMGWVRIAFQNAFYQLLHAATLEEGVINTVRAGGDTDTNAAIVGALLGAVHGRPGIPAQWMDRVLTCRPIQGLQGVKKPRPASYWPVDALSLAERLLLAGLEISDKKEFPIATEYKNGDERKDRNYEFKPLGYSPSQKDLDVVLSFIPMLEKNRGESFYRWEGGGVDDEGVINVARPIRDWKIEEFIWCLINYGFVQDFDWMEWGKEAKRYEEAPELIAEADLETCIKLLTCYQRADRFVDGYFAHIIESGQLVKTLRRLGNLRERGEIPSGDSRPRKPESLPKKQEEAAPPEAGDCKTRIVRESDRAGRDARKIADEMLSKVEDSYIESAISMLLDLLASANDEAGASSMTSRKIRRELRKRGHRGGLRGTE